MAKPIDVQKHADAMAAIRRALAEFPPEEQMVMVSGVLGDVLCTVGQGAPTRASAKMYVGSAIDMVFDMIDRNFDSAA